MSSIPLANPANLNPYVSLVAWEYVGSHREAVVPLLGRELARASLRTGRGRRAVVIAHGLPDGWLERTLQAGPGEFLRVHAYIYRLEKAPSWGTGYEDVTHHLCLLLQRNNYVAIHGPKDDLEALDRRLLRSDVSLELVSVSADTLEGVFLQGDTKNVWLKAIHSPTTVKADTKAYSGSSVSHVSDLTEDRTYALVSGRSELTQEAEGGLDGTWGTTPSVGRIWKGPTPSLSSYVLVVRHALATIEERRHSAPPSPLSMLARRMDSFDGVVGAFDLTIADPEEVLQRPNASELLVETADYLQGKILDIEGSDTSHHFTIIVGEEGAEMARLRCKPSFQRGRVVLTFFYDRGSDGGAESIKRSLERAGSALLSVYYQTGHVLSHQQLNFPNQDYVPFSRWRYDDFTGTDLKHEKPPGIKAGQKIHDAIGRPEDRSLFGWVARSFSSGHLTCDDGPGEIADFIHLGQDGTLTLIHVKSASGSARRGISTDAFHVVVAQAEKNAAFLRLDMLIEALGRPSVPNPATWLDGVRVPDRQSMIAALRARPIQAGKHVLIVQPHHTEKRDAAARKDLNDGKRTVAALRLSQIDTLLSAARGAVIRAGAEDLVVYAHG